MHVRTIKQIVLVVLVLGMWAVGLLLLIARQFDVGGWEIAGPVLLTGLTLLYWRGWEWAAPLTVLVVALSVGLLIPEPFVTIRFTQLIFLPSLLAIILARIVWVVLGAIIPLLILLYRANWQGIYTDPVLLAITVTLVSLMVISRIALDLSRRDIERTLKRVEVQTRDLALQRDALSDSEARYRLITEHVGDLVCLLDQMAHFIYLSPSFQTALGYNPNDLVGKYAFQLVHPTDLPTVLVQWGQVQLTGRGKVTFRYRHADGSWRWFDASGALLHWQGRSMAVIVGHNTTENRQLSAQLEHVQRMDSIGRLAGGIAHDFNNLLTVILGHVELASLQIPPEDPVNPEIEGMRRAVEQAQALTRQLLAFARRQAISPQIVDLNAHVEATSALLQRLIGTQIELTVELTPDLWPIKIDPSQLEQILLNLAINARDAMPNGGCLRISTANVTLDTTFVAGHLDAQLGPHVQLTVRDTGTGMSDEVLSHLFEPFYTTKPSGQGTGMGLAICYGIVRQNSGIIWAESTVGVGTAMHICLPRPDAAL
jgi:PAS domain S-box-containing protein